MADVVAIGFICILAVGVDWLFRSSRLRVFMYLVFMAAAITSCTKLGEKTCCSTVWSGPSFSRWLAHDCCSSVRGISNGIGA